MPVDYYPQKSVSELVAILEQLQKRQVGGVLTEVSGAGIKTVRDMKGSGNSKVETEILRVLWSLFRRAKGTEEAENWPDPYAHRLQRTRAHYTFS